MNFPDGQAAALRLHALWVWLGWGLAACIIWFSLVPKPPQIGPQVGDKVHHLMAYFILMFWFGQLHSRRLSLVFACLGLGLSLEWLQGLTGYRTASGLDMLANTTGVFLAWALLTRAPNLLARVETLWP